MIYIVAMALLAILNMGTIFKLVIAGGFLSVYFYMVCAMMYIPYCLWKAWDMRQWNRRYYKELQLRLPS